MKIALVLGHSILKSGGCTSADGRQYGGCNEYKFNKKFIKQIAKQLRKKKYKVDVVKCPERKFDEWEDERRYKLSYLNARDYDLIIELHLNAIPNPNAHGAEVLYKSSTGKKYAKAIQKELGVVFLNRGIAQRTDLYMLNGTKDPAIILETFFCTSKSDYKKANTLGKRTKIAKLIANGIENALKK